MERKALKYLQQWLASSNRKPIVIRGARQVGKTWLARELARANNKEIIELNFEKNPKLVSIFSSNNPREIVNNIEALFSIEIIPENSILFLDEVQAAPKLLSKLRWFYEELPQLAVITAGSLLEFVLANHEFSMPVGRISYLYLEPLSFEEFLLANNELKLHEFIQAFEWDKNIAEAIHLRLLDLFKQYIIVGGLPAIISNWVENNSLEQVNRLQHELFATYRDDFAKYSGRVPVDRIEDVLNATPKMLGEKFVFRRVNKDAQAASIKNALHLLIKAKLCHQVISTAGNGIPLAAETNNKFFKVVGLDTGLTSTALGLKLHQLNDVAEIELINKGGIAEQVVGQLLRTIDPIYIEPQLYYWTREQKGSNAELDYLLQHHSKVVPLEVKAGSTGGLKSLHLFMQQKNLSSAVRINSDVPSKTAVNTKTQQGEEVAYKLYSLPFYLVGQLHRLIE